MDERSTRVLGDITVLEVGQSDAVAFCGKLLAELGATVVKVEPREGSPTRNVPPFAGGEPHLERSIPFLYLNTAKRSLALDPSDEGDRLRFQEAIAAADIVVCGRGGNEAGQWNISAASADNPRLIVATIEPFGHGPYAGFRMTELVAQAIGGLLQRTGTVERGPTKIGGSPASYVAGASGFGALMAAILQRDETGLGQQVIVSIHEATASTQMVASIGATWQGVAPERAAPEELQKAADGWVSSGLSHVGGSPQTWKLVCDLLERPDLADDPRFNTGELRKQNRDALDEIVQSWLAKQSKEAVYHRLQALKAVAGYVATTADLFDSEQLISRGLFQEICHPVVGSARYPGVPFRLGETTPVYAPAPLLGEMRELTLPSANAAPAASSPAAKDYALTGVRVLDLTQIAVGPYVTFYLSNLGADVIKVESNKRPDGIRGAIKPGPAQKKSYPFGDPGERPWNRIGTFNQRNRGKLGITLDFADPAGRRVLERLIASSDILVENFRASVMDRQGLGWDKLRELNPRLVYLKLSSQGDTGPERDYGSVGPTLEQTSGLASITGYPGDRPSMTNQAFLDPAGSIFGVGAALAALRHARRTGEGQFIDFSQRELAVSLIGEAILDYELNGNVQGPGGSRSLWMAPQGVYPCAAGRWIAISVEDDSQWNSLCQLIGDGRWEQQSLALDERLARHDEIDEWLSAWTAQFAHTDLMLRLQEAGVAAGAVLDGMEILSNPQLVARDWWEDLKPTEVETTHRFTGAPWRLSRSPYRPSTPAPTLGEHNDKVFLEMLGLDEDEYRTLQEAGVISTVPLWERN